MSDTQRLERLLGADGEVRLARREAHDVLHKLRARGAGGSSADWLESRLGQGDEVVLPQEEAQALLEELRASGRRWVFGSEAPRERPAHTRNRERKADPEPERPGGLRRLWRR